FLPRIWRLPSASCARSGTGWKDSSMNMQVNTSGLAGKENLSAQKAVPARSRRRLWQVLALVVLAACAAYFVWPWLHARWTHVVLDDARIAANMVTVSSEVAGRVTALSVIAGDSVERGQVLADVDPSTIEQDLTALAAQIRGVRAQE